MINSRLRELIRCGVLHPFACPEGGKGGAAPAPDYRGAAEEQSGASKELATQNTWANRPTINTPWGQQSWTAGTGTDPSTGQAITNWTQNLNLTPEQQSALDAQNRMQAGKSGAAEMLLGQAVSGFQQPFDWSNLPQRANTPQGMGTGAGNLQTGVGQTGQDVGKIEQTTQSINEPGFLQERQRVEEGLFNRMAPQHQAAEAQLQTRLANMGLSEGSAGYNAELGRLRESQSAERFNAMQTAGQEQQRNQQMVLGQQGQAFGQGMQSQAQQNQGLQNLFGQGLQAGNFYNQAAQQGFNQNLGANNQNFNQQMQMANFQNQNRMQAIAEQAQMRGMSLNELNALLTGQQVQMPGGMQGAPSSTASMGQAPGYLDAAIAQGNYGNANKDAGMDWGSAVGGVASVAAIAL